VLTLVPLGFFSQIVRLPAALALSLEFVLQLLSQLAAPEEAGEAFQAHIGGFIAGIWFIPLSKQKHVKLTS
jgi:membrane associated rhomboid family serine protease